ncbi:MAG: phosphate signaling complex protein PhoU [Acidimicrobiia bacterium]|nr:phosphate signaling complex protein PhoU [Acidimicrobiia bacterium]
MGQQPHLTPPPSGEHRVAYHRDLDELTRGVIRLGAMACETVPRATEALLSGSLSDAQAVIDEDDAIDALTLELEEKCVSIIALQAPMAGDLRRLLTIMKLVAEIERSADLAVNICKASRRMYGTDLSPGIRGLIASMSREAIKLLRLSIDAFADNNDSLAVALNDIDDELDQLNRDMVEAIFAAHDVHTLDLAGAVQLALISRYYERIGDHAVNIGERVTYMITGWTPEHIGMMRAGMKANGELTNNLGGTGGSGTSDGGDDQAES